jgi:hypothetical protein
LPIETELVGLEKGAGLRVGAIAIGVPAVLGRGSEIKTAFEVAIFGLDCVFLPKG